MRKSKVLTEEDTFYDLLDSRRYDEAYRFLMNNPKILDNITVANLRHYYHQCFQGLIPEEEITEFFKTLEGRVRSTDL